MTISENFTKHYNQIKKGGKVIFFRKLLTLIKILLTSPLYLVFFPILIIIYLIRPWFLIRFQWLPASRIGYFTVNTELYCCERDVGMDDPGKPLLDLFCLKDICNKQLAKMWKRELKILPTWILVPLLYTNSFFCKFSYIIGLGSKA